MRDARIQTAGVAPEATRPRSGLPKQSPQSWKKDPGGRRQRVLDEATRLFAERGYASVSAGDIAKAAGVAEGSLFHYFGSKPELLRAVGERYGHEFAAAMFGGGFASPDAADGALPHGPKARPDASKNTTKAPRASVGIIRSIVARAFDFVEASWPGFGLFLLSENPSAAPLAQRANRLTVTRAVESVLEEWMKKGLLEKVDAAVVAEILFGVVEAALRACFADGRASGRERYERATVTAISRMLGIAGD